MNQFLMTYFWVTIAAVSGSKWPASLQFLANSDDGTFHAFVDPLANMTTLSYTATWGAYHEKQAEKATVRGWRRAEPEANPQAGGMRALTFLHDNTSLGVVAFRGTDLDRTGVSGQADACADTLLSGKPLPPACSRFTVASIDYLSRARDFAAEVAQRYPKVDWLYTGHSLGALLAEAIASERHALALVFSAPPVLPVLRNRSAVDPSKLPRWATMALYNEYDPLKYEAEGNLPGASCVWKVAPVPPGCAACELSDHAVNMTSASCRLCFAHTHVYKYYLELLASKARPNCSGAEAELLGDLVV